MRACAARSGRWRRWTALLATAALTLAVPAVAAATSGPSTVRVSSSPDGAAGNNDSSGPSLSADGRFVAFDSRATNLVAGDTNPEGDVFVHDRDTGAIERVSVSSDGDQANGESFQASISADGRYVAFSSDATNLVEGDTNAARDVFVHDRQTGETERVSVATDGTEGDNNSSIPSISADGRFVVFSSFAANLLEGAGGGVFVHDRETGETTLVSVSSDGASADGLSTTGSTQAISSDGRFVVFDAQASNLTEGPTSGLGDVFVRDRQAEETTLVSVFGDGSQETRRSFGGSISADGRFVAFLSGVSAFADPQADHRVDVFVHDRQSGQTTLVSVASDGSEPTAESHLAMISGNGQFVAFTSEADNLVAGVTNGLPQLYVRDLQAGMTTLASVSTTGNQGNGPNLGFSLNADGRFVAFSSYAFNLVPDDVDDDLRHVFVRDRVGTAAADDDDPDDASDPDGDPVLELTVDAPSTAVAGEPYDVTITATNTGEEDLDDITIVVEFSDGTEVVDTDASAGTVEMGSVIWTLETLAAGATETLVITLVTAEGGSVMITVTGPDGLATTSDASIQVAAAEEELPASGIDRAPTLLVLAMLLVGLGATALFGAGRQEGARP